MKDRLININTAIYIYSLDRITKIREIPISEFMGVYCFKDIFGHEYVWPKDISVKIFFSYSRDKQSFNLVAWKGRYSLPVLEAMFLSNIISLRELGHEI